MLSTKCAPSHRSFFLAGLLALLLLSTLPAQAQSLCESYLENPSGATVPVHDDPLDFTDEVDEWDSEIIKIRPPAAGTLAIGAAGPEAEVRIYVGNPSENEFQFVNGSTVSTSHPEFSTVVGAKDYCIEVKPADGTSGSLTIEVTFLDNCLVGSPDDHGNTFACATSLALEGSDSGTISELDVDVFTLELTATKTVVFESSGDADATGSLYNSIGTLLASDDDNGPGNGFQITQSLAAGRYYLTVKSEDGETDTYSVSATEDSP